MVTSLITQEQDSLEFKADFFPMTVIKLNSTDLTAIKRHIATTIIAAPHYFKYAPVVIDTHAIIKSNTLNLGAICQILRDQNMIPVGIRGLDKTQEETARSKGLAIMKAPKSAKKKTVSSLTTNNTPNETPKAEPQKNNVNTKMITMPVRSGTQVYARDGDLVVTAAVNAGGECFADGNIHIYGPLRGKALAGANGNEQARIFCQSLEAELISIAGHYLTSDRLQIPHSNKPMIQILLKAGKIQIDSI